MCFHHSSPSGIACLLLARGLPTPISEERRHLARCLLQASEVLLYCNLSVRTPLPNCPRETPPGSKDQGPIHEIKSCEEVS